MEIKELLQDIPLLLQYFVPGFVCISVFGYLSSKKYEHAQSFIVNSVVISYVLVSITEAIVEKEECLKGYKESILLKSGMAFLNGLVASIIYEKDRINLF